MNNDPLPANWDDNGTTRVITAGTVTLNANNEFTWSETIDGFTDTETGDCTLTTSPSTYTCVPDPKPGEDQTPGIAVFNGNALTLTLEGADVRVYNKTSN